MRNVIPQLAETTAVREQRQVMHAAARQLERAQIYLAAVAYMDLDDGDAERAVNQLRTDAENLRRYLGARRDRLTE